MDDQGNAMRSRGMARLGLRRDDGLHDIETSEHCGREDVDPRPSRHEEAGNVAPPHMGCGSKASLPIAAAPIPGGVEERRMGLEKHGDLFEIRMRISDETLDELRIEPRCLCHGILLSR